MYVCMWNNDKQGSMYGGIVVVVVVVVRCRRTYYFYYYYFYFHGDQCMGNGEGCIYIVCYIVC